MFLYSKGMPELPEVEITTRKLQPLTGKTIQSFWNDRAVAAKNIRGLKVLRIFRRGKAIVFELSGARILAFHQRMSGRLLIVDESYDRMIRQQYHIHAKINFNDKSRLLFQDPRKFGVIWYGSPEEVYSDKYFSTLGPDALGIRKADFILRFKNRRGGIKALLLNQKCLAGIGNVVADETLWQAKIHPKTQCLTLNVKQIGALHNALQVVLRRSIEVGGTTLRDWGHPDGQKGRFQNHLCIYGCVGKPCKRCGQKIQRIICAGRGTSLCEKCQSKVV